MKKFTSLFAVAIVLTALSCQKTIDMKPAEQELSTQTATISVIDGRLRFASKEHLYRVIHNLAKQQDNLDGFEKQFTGYVSARTAFQKLTDYDNESIAKNGLTDPYKGYTAIIGQGDNREITRTINSPVLATLVSKDGWLYIDKDAYLFERDKFYIVKNYTAARMARVGEGVKTGSDIQVGEISHTSPSVAGARRASEDHCLQEYWVGSNKRRMAGVIGADSYSTPGGTFWINVYCVTKHQRRTLGTIWSTYDTQSVRTSGSLSVRDYSGNVTTQTYDELRGNTGWAERDFASFQGPDLPGGSTWNPVYSNIVNNATANCNDGVTRTCTVTRQ